MFYRNCLALALAAAAPLAAGADYARQYERGVEACEAIPASESVSGLWMNPSGYQAYYKRSACFQQLAVKMRDAALCRQVKRRWSLLSSSWGYSASNCADLVAEGIEEDKASIAAMRAKYAAGPVRLVDFGVEQNGNGRDYDIVPRFAGGAASGYHLSFWILHAGQRYLLSESGFHLDGGNRIRMFEYRRDIAARFPGFRPGADYEVEGRLTLSIGAGSLRGLWSPEFIEREFPENDRTRVLVRRVSF